MINYNLNNRAVLFRVAREVSKDDNLNELIKAMYYVMENNKIKGVGLAAPQVGWSQRVITTNILGYDCTVLNPVITRRRLGQALSREGCLSFPETTGRQGKYVTMVRDKQIIVEGFDENWRPIKLKLRGFASFVFQHEIDHLNGICIKSD